MNLVTILLQKARVIVVPPEGSHDSRSLVIAIEKNIENLGFSLTRRLARALALQSESFLTELYQTLIPELKKQKGAHVDFRPMYPNFPAQVIAMDEIDLYWNAIFHYITLADPNTEMAQERLPLVESESRFVSIDLGVGHACETLLTTLIHANAPLAQSDKEIVVYLIETLPNAEDLLNGPIPQRETLALVGATLLKKNPSSELGNFAKTATDVLRVATQLSGGDISLAEKTKYAKFPRPIRRALLQALEFCGDSLEEDMMRHAGKWIRLGEILHPGQYNIFPKTLAAFDKLRKDIPIPTFNSSMEAAIKSGDWKECVTLLSHRPGEFLRRLDHLMRIFKPHAKEVFDTFLTVADKCATPALLNLYHHFQNRTRNATTRSVFPKGTTAKMQIISAPGQSLPAALCHEASDAIKDLLKMRFSKLGSLGKVYLDPLLANYPVPFAQRSDSRTLRTLPKGSRVRLDEGPPKNTLRFFVHWKNGEGQTDIDLSCAFLNETFGLVSTISYYNLKDVGGAHSGDITDAPDGASEFIDVDIEKVRTTGARYIAAIVFSYRRQSLRSLPECFFGWMTRENPQRGEIFEPKTVRTKADLSGDTKCAIPVLIDIETRQVIWCDIAVGSHPHFPNNAECNKPGISLICRNFAAINKPTLHTLLRFHIEARGEPVDDVSEADRVFLEDWAYEGATISSEFLS